MNAVRRFTWVLVAVSLLAVDAESLVAQINIGGFNQGNQNNDNNQNQGQGRRRSQSGNQSDVEEQFQQFLQGGQNQGSQGQGQQGQRRNQQGQFQQGQFQGNQQFQNQQQLQNFQQGNQGGLRIGTWQGGKWQGSNKVQNWTQVFGGNQQPFSSQWYNDHPKAWKYNNNQADVWVIATLPGVYNWLGWGDVPPQYRANYGNVQHHHFDPTHYGDWYPLGVYSLMAGPGDIGTRIVQLAVDRNGNIAGNYYDMITNNNYSVSGQISRNSQNVSWRLNKNQAIRFRTHISQLLQPYGNLTVRLPGGEQQWQFVRLED